MDPNPDDGFCSWIMVRIQTYQKLQSGSATPQVFKEQGTLFLAQWLCGYMYQVHARKDNVCPRTLVPVVPVTI